MILDGVLPFTSEACWALLGGLQGGNALILPHQLS